MPIKVVGAGEVLATDMAERGLVFCFVGEVVLLEVPAPDKRLLAASAAKHLLAGRHDSHSWVITHLVLQLKSDVRIEAIVVVEGLEHVREERRGDCFVAT